MTTAAHPLVSVIVPFYNCPFVSQCLDSILTQTYAPVEIVVIDDGSTAHMEQLTPYMSRIRYIRKANGGTASALNVGILAAQGEYIAWLSSDDRMKPNKLARQVAYMRQHQALICCTDFDLIDAHNNVLHPALAAKFPSARLFIEALLHYCPINGSTIMMHRSLPPAIGLFDESLLCVQDYEYWIRVHLARVDFHYLNESLTWYRWHGGMGTQRMKERSDHEFAVVRDRYAPHLHALLSQL